MRAILHDSFGGPEVLRLAEVDRPEPAFHQVLIRVLAAGVNPADWKARREPFDLIGGPPLIPGWDVSGVVEAAGRGVTRFRPGDEVHGLVAFPYRASAYAEYTLARPRDLARKPRALSHAEAAALPMAALTAWQALVEFAEVRRGDRVLVHAAGGGVGHLAVQIAKARGAHVIGTARAGKHALLRGLGADELIDYTATDFTTAVEGADVVFDLVGGDYSLRSLRVLRRGGLLVAGAPPAPGTAAEAEARGVRYGALQVEPDRAALERIGALAGEGRLRVHVEREFPLAEAAAAHELGEKGRVTGKLVLTM
ncbi:NADP-dependent oxidoreductase [Bailinhaonella thermotolerans]|uniref:NADP-dependent oxidoreductase n=1 Tax=Bailinhaonella thermotolerans TaxID=1070861 RepID=A0A3A4B7G1_9ACTN|nr:NADP-dependent oxidoreductase [Bailinhaonella thermotolerans]RJL34161.1 NADP-dependent oxidoreductase [Bailinhaonella thermotolerans]